LAKKGEGQIKKNFISKHSHNDTIRDFHSAWWDSKVKGAKRLGARLLHLFPGDRLGNKPRGADSTLVE